MRVTWTVEVQDGHDSATERLGTYLKSSKGGMIIRFDDDGRQLQVNPYAVAVRREGPTTPDAPTASIAAAKPEPARPTGKRRAL